MSLASAVCNLIMFVFMVWAGETGTNRFGPDPKGTAPDISVFEDESRDARIDDAIALAKGEAVEASKLHKPVFDFGPGSSQPMINAYGRETQNTGSASPAPRPTGWTSPAHPANAPRKAFGRR